ncbi:Metallo-dependent phosphatase-like protein [Radiomyces spectabilis]|uniref:Metallo-dependent phosphatase-like protein n=1 Tax=Radiomyces spectabilis TaxID=64574 RepID=UPI00221E3FE7|nr:Metallo-dependent phosphatase-like protein [Radiomyces spectabilis]KAI8393824.1 Metallo-dependent phosphatase-like protein [Radiomyces spectabilis]
MNLQPNYEPYSSVSFQHKQPTSPYPQDRNDRINRDDLFLKALENRGNISSLPLTTAIPHRWPRWNKKRTLFFAGILSLLLIYYWSRLQVLWAFLMIKLDNSLFDRGWIPCGTIRKQPMLYVHDTQHVQIVWEMNCGMREKDMWITWQPVSSKKAVNVRISPLELDARHFAYKATIGPLDADTNYRYDIRTNKGKVLTRHTFSWYANTEMQTIRVAAMADNQFGMNTFATLLRQVSRLKHKPHYLLHAGDAVQQYFSLRQWETDFVGPLTYYHLGQSMPMIYAHGNHDHDPTYEYHYTRTNPSNDPWYAFSMANGAIRWCILDSNLDWIQQDEWLRRELASEASQQAHFRVVVVHVPPFIEYWEPEGWFEKKQSEWGAFVKDRFVPLFEKYGVDLVISGHQHNYQRGERNGVHYAIIGGAGGDLDFEKVADWRMYDSSVLDFHYVMMEFQPSDAGRWHLVWNAYNLNNQKVDTMQLDSKPPGSRLIEADHEGAVDGSVIEELTLMDLDDGNIAQEEEADVVNDQP